MLNLSYTVVLTVPEEWDGEGSPSRHGVESTREIFRDEIIKACLALKPTPTSRVRVDIGPAEVARG